MTKILVTGANGQLGSELQKLSSANKNMNFLFTDVENLDITDANMVDQLMNSEKPDFLVNCAAYTAVDKAETDKATATLINKDAVTILTESCNKYNTKFIHISTDYVFNGENFKPYTENDIVNPNSVYGFTKLAGEKEVLKYDNGMIIRTSWLYSTFGNNFVKTMLRLASERDSLNVVFDQVGTPTNAADLAEAILIIVNKTFVSGVYHYSNEGVCSWYDFAIEIFNIADVKCKVSPIKGINYPAPAPRPFYSVLNKEKIKETYNLSIPHWKESLDKCIQQLEK